MDSDTSSEFQAQIEMAVSQLRKFGFVHSIILFGSQAKNTQRANSDVDICIIPEPQVDVSLKERISLSNAVPENIDISLLGELPVYIRKRVFLEGKVFYTEDPYYILTLAKENDLEYSRYRKMKFEYHKSVMKRVKSKLR